MTELIAEISKLSIAERIALVQAILQTIASESMPGSAFALSEEQKSELEERSATIVNGTSKAVTWESIQAKLAERYGLPG